MLFVVVILRFWFALLQFLGLVVCVECGCVIRLVGGFGLGVLLVVWFWVGGFWV